MQSFPHSFLRTFSRTFSPVFFYKCHRERQSILTCRIIEQKAENTRITERLEYHKITCATNFHTLRTTPQISSIYSLRKLLEACPQLLTKESPPRPMRAAKQNPVTPSSKLILMLLLMLMLMLRTPAIPFHPTKLHPRPRLKATRLSLQRMLRMAMAPTIITQLAKDLGGGKSTTPVYIVEDRT